MAKVIRGTIHCVSACGSSCCNDEWYLETPDNKMIRIKPHADMQPEQYVEVTLQGNVVEDFSVLVENSTRSMQDIDLALVLVRRHPSEITSQLVRQLEIAAEQLAAELRRFSHNRWNVKITPLTYVSSCKVEVTSFCWGQLEQAHPGYTHYHVWGGKRTDICGHAFVGGKYAVTFPNCGIQTIIHETGHLLGLRHSSTPDHEYGDQPWSWMASGLSRTRWTAPHYLEAGLVDTGANKVLAQGEEGCYFLIDAESSPLSRRPGEYKIITMNLRLPSWSSTPVSLGLINGRLHIYTGEARGFRRTVRIAEVLEGETFRDGLHVKYDKNESGVARILLSWKDALPNPTPFPKWTDVDTSGNFSGLWYHPDMDYQGFQIIDVSDKKRVAWWYTADRNRNLKWFYIEDEKLYSTVSGEFKEEGQCRFYKVAEDKIRVEGYSALTGRFAFTLYKLANASSTRAYSIEGREREGLVIDDYGIQEVGYYYTRHGWSMLQNGMEYVVKGARFLVKSDAYIEEVGPYTLENNTLKLSRGPAMQLKRFI